MQVWLCYARRRTSCNQCGERVVARHGKDDRLDGLVCIGVDEISYPKHHKYLTVVVDHDRGETVWGKPGKSAKTLTAFFDELGPERCAQLDKLAELQRHNKRLYRAYLLKDALCGILDRRQVNVARRKLVSDPRSRQQSPN